MQSQPTDCMQYNDDVTERCRPDAFDSRFDAGFGPIENPGNDTEYLPQDHPEFATEVDCSQWAFDNE